MTRLRAVRLGFLLIAITATFALSYGGLMGVLNAHDPRAVVAAALIGFFLVGGLVGFIQCQRLLLKDEHAKIEIDTGPPSAQRETVWRTCECCGKTHECHETFREMVDRCARERNGAIIIH